MQEAEEIKKINTKNKYAENPIKEIKRILGIQERLI